MQRDSNITPGPYTVIDINTGMDWLTGVQTFDEALVYLHHLRNESPSKKFTVAQWDAVLEVWIMQDPIKEP